MKKMGILRKTEPHNCSGKISKKKEVLSNNVLLEEK